MDVRGLLGLCPGWVQGSLFRVQGSEGLRVEGPPTLAACGMVLGEGTLPLPSLTPQNTLKRGAYNLS